MKGGIDKHGNLWIDRAGDKKGKLCPWNQEGVSCGDWCPLFREPRRDMAFMTIKKPKPTSFWKLLFWEKSGVRCFGPTGRTKLQICKRTLTFDEFTDEREVKDES
jgi:hypothetical protein